MTAASDAGRERLPISVVIPAYNAERYIAEALESVFTQTRPPAEVIVVDDGSPDRSGELARSLGATVVRRENGGMCAARNTGIAAATQEWVAFLDADDLWVADKLEKQWAALQARPDVAFAFCDGREFDARGERPQTIMNSVLLEHWSRVERTRLFDNVAYCDHESLTREFIPGHFIMGGSTLVVRRDLLRRVGSYSTRLVHWGDYELMLRLLTATSGVVVEEALFRYRRHASNMSSEGVGMKIDETIVAELIAEHPDAYPPAARAFWRAENPANLAAVGKLLIRQGRQRAARTYLRRSLRERFSLDAALAYGVSYGVAFGLRPLLPVMRGGWHAFRGGATRVRAAVRRTGDPGRRSRARDASA